MLDLPYFLFGAISLLTVFFAAIVATAQSVSDGVKMWYSSTGPSLAAPVEKHPPAPSHQWISCKLCTKSALIAR